MNRENNHSPFDDLPERYDTWFDEEGKLIFAIEVAAFNSILHLLPKPWLEIGVGSGRFAQALGIEFGIDPSTKLLQMAIDRGIDARHGRGEDRLFQEKSIGTVFLIVTICFINSPEKVFREIERILHPDGRLVIGLVLKEGSWGSYYQKLKENKHPFYKFARFFSYDELAKILMKSGFLIDRTVSTLFQIPGKVVGEESPREGYWPNAGFIILVARKENR